MGHVIADQIKGGIGNQLILGVFKYIECLLHVAIQQRQHVGTERLLQFIQTVC